MSMMPRGERLHQLPHESSECNASLSFSATLGEEPEVEVALA